MKSNKLNEPKATCKTCGGTVPNHVPSVLDAEGVGHPAHATGGTPKPVESYDPPTNKAQSSYFPNISEACNSEFHGSCSDHPCNCVCHKDELDEVLAQYILPASQHNGVDKRAEAKAAINQIIANQVAEQTEIRLMQARANIFTQFNHAMQLQALSATPPEGARFRTPLEELVIILERELPLATLKAGGKDNG